MADLELGPLRFGVVGAGRLGCTLALALRRDGFEVVHASSATADGRERASRLLGIPVHEDPLDATIAVDCVLLCVPDDAVPDVVARLTARPDDASPMRLRIVSTSAPGGMAVLDPLREAGHDCCVVHPVASIASLDAEASPLAGCGAAVGATDDAARTFAHALAHALGMHPFDLAEPAWPLHAAACSVAATFVATLLAMAEELAAAAGVHPGIARGTYSRLAAGVVQRAAADGGLASLAGPALRGDASALAAQVAAVADAQPTHDMPFRTLAGATVRMAFEGGRLDLDAAARLGSAIGTGPHDHGMGG